MAISSETYPLTLPTSEKLPLSSYGLSAHNRCKHVRLGVVAVQICNPITGQPTKVYVFQDSGSQMTLLRKSVTDEIGLQGMLHIQLCKGLHATANIHTESATLHIRGIHEITTYSMTDVKITDNVPEVKESLPDTLVLEEHVNFL